jgi:hypothetical protein
MIVQVTSFGIGIPGGGIGNNDDGVLIYYVAFCLQYNKYCSYDD